MTGTPGGWIAVGVVAGVGLVLLAGLALRLLGPVRRFARTSAEQRAATARRVGRLRTAVDALNSRRSGGERRTNETERAWSTPGPRSGAA